MWNWPHFNSYAYVNMYIGALDCVFAIFQLHEWFHRKILYQQLYQTLDSTSSTTLVDSVPFLQNQIKLSTRGERSLEKGIKEWYGYFMWFLSLKNYKFTIILFTVTSDFFSKVINERCLSRMRNMHCMHLRS